MALPIKLGTEVRMRLLNENVRKAYVSLV